MHYAALSPYSSVTIQYCHQTVLYTVHPTQCHKDTFSIQYFLIGID